MESILNKFKTWDGENVNKLDQNGLTMLMFFSKSDTNFEFVKALLENPNINLDKKNNDGKSAYDIAVDNKSAKIIELFDKILKKDLKEEIKEIPKEITYLELVEKDDFDQYCSKMLKEIPNNIPNSDSFMSIAIRNKSLKFIRHFCELYFSSSEHKYFKINENIVQNLELAALSEEKEVLRYLIATYKKYGVIDSGVIDSLYGGTNVKFDLFENALVFGDLEIATEIFKLVENIATISNLNFAINYSVSKEFKEIAEFLTKKRSERLSKELIDFISEKCKTENTELIDYVKEIIKNN